jgi:mono/diheme cytochrome c family protein
MYLNRSRKPEARSRQRMFRGRTGFVLISVFCILVSACGVRYDMQDMPRYKVYKKSEFFNDGRASRDLPEGTVARGLLKENKALYTGKVDNPDPNAQAQTSLNAAGNTVMTTFPNMIDEFPVPVTKELIDRGQERFNIYCIVCHGPTGNGDGMIVRRGFIVPPTYHDDRLRNAPVGHFFDVMTNGFGRMNSYAAQVPVHDRWAIVAYIRALQVSQNPSAATLTPAPAANTAAPAQQSTPNASTPGGGH